MEELLKAHFDVDENPFNKMVLYATSGGKYIRGNIILDIEPTMTNSAMAIELIHSASLNIDDLPCMDNDDMRRNKASTFKKFGENMAILVSAYMLNHASLLIGKDFGDKNINQLSIVFSKISALMCGQYIDLQKDITDVKKLIELKTCSLFELTFILPFLRTDKSIEDAINLGKSLGYMYQIWDDFDDIDQDSSVKNIVLHDGITKSKEIYELHYKNFTKFLEKNSLNSELFTRILNKIKLNI